MPPKRLVNNVMRILQEERELLTDKLSRVDAAIKAIGAMPPSNRKGRKAGFKMSAEAREKISKAAKARWARIKR